MMTGQEPHSTGNILRDRSALLLQVSHSHVLADCYGVIDGRRAAQALRVFLTLDIVRGRSKKGVACCSFAVAVVGRGNTGAEKAESVMGMS